MNEGIISLLEQIELFKQEDKLYEAPEAQKLFARISYYTSIQNKLKLFEESKVSS
jgi:hypothetical protein